MGAPVYPCSKAISVLSCVSVCHGSPRPLSDIPPAYPIPRPFVCDTSGIAYTRYPALALHLVRLDLEVDPRYPIRVHHALEPS
jgi:hypothetical protein